MSTGNQNPRTSGRGAVKYIRETVDFAYIEPQHGNKPYIYYW